MRLIDKDALIKKLDIAMSCSECKHIDGAKCVKYNRFTDACEEICKAPTIEIVTCDECKHSTYDSLFHERWCRGREVDDDWFCKDGARA